MDYRTEDKPKMTSKTIMRVLQLLVFSRITLKAAQLEQIIINLMANTDNVLKRELRKFSKQKVELQRKQTKKMRYQQDRIILILQKYSQMQEENQNLEEDSVETRRKCRQLPRNPYQIKILNQMNHKESKGMNREI